jgi:hypothetical protein
MLNGVVCGSVMLKGNTNMTKMSKLLKQLSANKNKKIGQAILGKIRKEIQSWSLSLDLKRSAYRTALRVNGHTDDYLINLYANEFIR